MAEDEAQALEIEESWRQQYRTVFVSDFHLGTRGCKARDIADFLKSMRCDRLFLVGDIVDGWRLRRGAYWDREHDRVVRRILKIAKQGTEVVYIPGNHDEGLRDWLDVFPGIAGIRLTKQAEHTTAKGDRLLVMHGDEFDGVIRYAKFLAHLGDWAYDWAIVFNGILTSIRSRLGYPYWSLSQWLKHRVKEAVKAIDRFEPAVAHEAISRGFQGVVCGHIHQAEMRDVDGIHYMNCGDWVESLTALVEHMDGRLEIIRWTPSAAVKVRDFYDRRVNFWDISCGKAVPMPVKRAPLEPDR